LKNYIGIIGAMEEEIESLLSKMEVEEQIVLGNIEFSLGELEGKSVIAAYSGIGKVQASICATVMITHFKVEKIIFTGVAGGLQSRIKVGDVVIGEKLLYHDMDCTGFGYPLGVIPRAKQSEFYSNEELIRTAETILKEMNQKYFIGTIVSGDQFLSDKKRAYYVAETFSALATEMEGAAVAHVATQFDIPFLVIRLISDGIDEDSKVAFLTFMKSAIIVANELVCKILKA